MDEPTQNQQVENDLPQNKESTPQDISEKPSINKEYPYLRWAILILTPITILFFGVLVSISIAQTEQKVSKKEQVDFKVEEVDIIEISPQPIKTTIDGYGAVRPQRQTMLTSEVSGRITYIAKSFKRGNFVKKGEILIKINPEDYEITYKLVKAELEEAKAEWQRLKKTSSFLQKELNLLKEQLDLRKKDLERSRKLATSGRLSEKEWESTRTSYLQQQQQLLATQKSLETLPHEIEKIKITIKRSEVNLKKAKKDLKRTVITSPFSAEVVAKNAEIGQFVSSGVELGQLAYDRIYEVVVKVDPEELQKIPYVPQENLPENLRDIKEAIGTPKAKVTWVAFGRSFKWDGTLVRIEPIDEKTRTLPLVVQIENPWLGLKNNNPPLLTGVYCQVSIEGVEIEKAMAVPEQAIREQDSIYLLRGDKLHIEKVFTYYSGGQYMIFPKDRNKKNAVTFGDLVITSPIMYPIQGMPLKIRQEK
ncbi:efflux RND transporter periplasmic adaptor subunit [Candidatus Uabimicrobium amorphum]|uniref:Hemolysin D n=1 Tax=Uabimicrobium amorphum TaxID=2596890 RepID=A0A5S9IKU5_UABAM|nr:HlyD family efflux transporter periplasmic adaptor subunit [Candidatus Uabimicrobium amorphum]BBM83296.1 hemolysin D [Candidatus Uabimicrobium amorphum]